MPIDYKSDFGLTNFALDEIQELRDNHVLVREDPIEAELLPSGLYAPEVASGPGHYRLATVIMVGPGFRKTTTDERLLKFCRHAGACRRKRCRRCDSPFICRTDGTPLTLCRDGNGRCEYGDCTCGLDRLIRGEHDPLDVKPGDRVMMGRHYDGDPLIIQGQTYMLCREDDIVGTLVPMEYVRDPIVDLEKRLTVQPLADRVLVALRDDLHARFTMHKPTEASGLVLADIAQGVACMGQALRVGPGWGLANGKREGMTVQPGDYVIFAGDTGQATRIGGKTYWTMRENEIIGICDLDGAMR